MIQNLLVACILAVGASALAVSPAHHARNAVIHQRHGPAVPGMPRSPIPVPAKALAQRGSAHRKRCIQRPENSGSVVPPTEQVESPPTFAPLNVEPVPLPVPIPDVSVPVPIPEVLNNTPPPSNPVSNGGDQITGQLTFFHVGLVNIIPWPWYYLGLITVHSNRARAVETMSTPIL